MPILDSDRAWKNLGETDPYYAVLTADRFRQANLTADSLREFFASGEGYVTWAVETARKQFDREFQPQRGLDFGCGTGRLTIALARYCQSVVGVDISPHMLEKARIHTGQIGLENIEYVLSDDSLSKVAGSFDFILSFIVLQHIPPSRGEQLLTQLLRKLRPNGIGCIHIPYAREASLLRQTGYRLRVRIPLIHWMLNRLARQPIRSPLIQYNAYPLNRIFHVIHEANCADIYTHLIEERDAHSKYNSAVLFFRKSG